MSFAPKHGFGSLSCFLSRFCSLRASCPFWVCVGSYRRSAGWLRTFRAGRFIPPSEYGKGKKSISFSLLLELVHSLGEETNRESLSVQQYVEGKEEPALRSSAPHTDLWGGGKETRAR